MSYYMVMQVDLTSNFIYLRKTFSRGYSDKSIAYFIKLKIDYVDYLMYHNQNENLIYYSFQWKRGIYLTKDLIIKFSSFGH